MLILRLTDEPFPIIFGHRRWGHDSTAHSVCVAEAHSLTHPPTNHYTRSNWLDVPPSPSLLFMCGGTELCCCCSRKNWGQRRSWWCVQCRQLPCHRYEEIHPPITSLSGTVLLLLSLAILSRVFLLFAIRHSFVLAKHNNGGWPFNFLFNTVAKTTKELSTAREEQKHCFGDFGGGGGVRLEQNTYSYPCWLGPRWRQRRTRTRRWTGQKLWQIK